MAHSASRSEYWTGHGYLQDILDEIAARDDLGKGWAVPVGTAVARCRAIFDQGAITLWRRPGDIVSFFLMSKNTIADLTIEVTRFDRDGAISRHVTQLSSGQPRQVDLN